MPIVVVNKETGEIVGGYGYKSGENGKVGNPDTGHPTPTKASGVEGLIPGAVAGSTGGALSAARGKGKKKPVPFN